MGQCRICTRFDFSFEGEKIVLRAFRLRMDFRVTGDFDAEMVAGLFADEGDQFIGMAQFAGAAGAGTRGQVAAQRHDVLHAPGFV